ncbi:MAG: alpha/beta fold hydrolase [Proteobacteria bacterium]|nr:alpha/beta fold hydrolase [Pseudomonadota bacterium]MDA1301343.1 alpha/beta fold hydrolase [Pseudomonadota bacterium]
MSEVIRRFIGTRSAVLEVFIMGAEHDRLALCLHGFPEHAISWRNQAQLLVDAGYCVWMPNLRGYGNSSRPLGVENYRISLLCDDAVDLIEHSGKSSAVIIGHDWGATIGWFLALADLAPALAGLVVVNSYHPGRFGAMLKPEQLMRMGYIGLILSGAPETLVPVMSGSRAGPARGYRRSAVSRPTPCWRITDPGGVLGHASAYRVLWSGGGIHRLYQCAAEDGYLGNRGQPAHAGPDAQARHHR